MSKQKPFTLLLFGGIALVSLTGCEQLEQATTDALEKTRQSAALALDEAVQTGSVDQARQSATQAIQEARQTAAGLLGQASEYLAKEPPPRDTIDPAGDDAASTL